MKTLPNTISYTAVLALIIFPAVHSGGGEPTPISDMELDAVYGGGTLYACSICLWQGMDCDHAWLDTAICELITDGAGNWFCRPSVVDKLCGVTECRTDMKQCESTGVPGHWCMDISPANCSSGGRIYRKYKCETDNWGPNGECKCTLRMHKVYDCAGTLDYCW